MSISAADRHASRRRRDRGVPRDGFNYRMTDIQAAVGLVQLERLDAIVERRAGAGAPLSRTPGRRARARDGERSAVRTHQLPVVLGRAPRCVPVARDDLLAADGARDLGPAGDHGGTSRAGVRGGEAHAPLPVTERLTRARSSSALPRDDRTSSRTA